MSNEIDDGYSIFKKIHASAGMQFLGRKKLRTFTLNVFVMNKIELQHDLALVENPEIGLQLMSQEYRDAGHQAHREINRRFHNFLASAKTLIDHTRAFMNDDYRGTSIEQKYKQRVTVDLATDEICRFMQDLRNYTLHRNLPISFMSLTYTKENGISSGVHISREELTEWSGWSAPARAFLSRSEEEINVSTIVEDYSSKIEAFHSWLDSALEDYHSADLDELRLLENEHERIMAK